MQIHCASISASGTNVIFLQHQVYAAVGIHLSKNFDLLGSKPWERIISILSISHVLNLWLPTEGTEFDLDPEREVGNNVMLLDVPKAH